MRRLPWVVWLAVVGLGVAISGSALDDGIGPFAGYVTFVLTFATVGALIASRRPRNAIGWIMLFSSLAYVVGGLTEAALDGARGDASTLAAWVGSWVWMAALAPVGTFALLLFPTGRLPSPRWRPVAWLAGAGFAALLAGLMFAPGRFSGTTIENPVGIGAARVLASAGAVALILGLAGSIASLFARYRAAGLDERLRLKWLLYAASLVAAGVALSLSLEVTLGPEVSNLANAITTVSAAAVPVAIGIAILRHRLYDIDLVIRRTLVYGALTATLAAGYLACVLLAQLVIGAESDLAVAASTLAVAALFRSARVRIQGAVDRRFYRRRYDAERTLEAFAARLRDELDLETVGDDLLGVAGDAVQPTHVSLWLRR